MPGHPRSVLFVVLMSVFTLGVYWLYWTRTAFEEIAHDENEDPPRVLWFLSVVAYVLMISVAISAGYFRTDYPLRIPSESLEAQTKPIILAEASATAVYFAAELAYLWGASRILQRAMKKVDEPSPSLFFLVFYCVSLAGEGVPKVGLILAFPGAIVSLFWLVQTQLAMNLYWKEIEARHWMPASGPIVSNAPPQSPT